MRRANDDNKKTRVRTARARAADEAAAQRAQSRSTTTIAATITTAATAKTTTTIAAAKVCASSARPPSPPVAVAAAAGRRRLHLDDAPAVVERTAVCTQLARRPRCRRRLSIAGRPMRIIIMMKRRGGGSPQLTRARCMCHRGRSINMRMRARASCEASAATSDKQTADPPTVVRDERAFLWQPRTASANFVIRSPRRSEAATRWRATCKRRWRRMQAN